MSITELDEPWGRQHKEAIAAFVSVLGLTIARVCGDERSHTAEDFTMVLSGYCGAAASPQDDPSKLELLKELLAHVTASVGSARLIETRRLAELAAQVDAAFRDGLSIEIADEDGDENNSG